MDLDEQVCTRLLCALSNSQLRSLGVSELWVAIRWDIAEGGAGVSCDTLFPSHSFS